MTGDVDSSVASLVPRVRRYVVYIFVGSTPVLYIVTRYAGNSGNLIIRSAGR